MERIVAIRKLRKLIGKGFAYRINPKALTGEEREAAEAELKLATAEMVRVRAERDDRYKAILAADPEYQRLLAAHNEAYKRQKKLMGDVHSRKISVGDTSSGFFYLVNAEGDSWEEVIDKLTAKASALVGA